MKANYGIDLSKKRVLIAGRLKNFLISNNYKSYDELMDKVEKNPDCLEAKSLINFLTTNHTYFMRESMHFTYMNNIVIPYFAKREASRRSLRVWCAASSTGEEPYTLVMLLQDYFGKQSARWDTRILATDISTKVLDKAKMGVYSNEQLKDLPKRWLTDYFERYDANSYKVKDKIKKEVIFRQFNLMDNFNFKGKFHIVFLRNVMIYFDEATKRKVVNKVYNCLDEGGYLFIGMAEVIDRAATKLKYIQPSIYQKA